MVFTENDEMPITDSSNLKILVFNALGINGDGGIGKEWQQTELQQSILLSINGTTQRTNVHSFFSLFLETTVIFIL